MCLIPVHNFSNFIYIYDFFRNLLGIEKLDKEKNQSIRKKAGAQNIVKEIKQYQQKWLQHV
jgi:threonine synthase